jgi:hypothetical protein
MTFWMDFSNWLVLLGLVLAFAAGLEIARIVNERNRALGLTAEETTYLLETFLDEEVQKAEDGNLEVPPEQLAMMSDLWAKLTLHQRFVGPQSMPAAK